MLKFNELLDLLTRNLEYSVIVEKYRSSWSSHSERLARGKRGKRRSKAVRQAISRAMKGKSNFEGHKHSKAEKNKIKVARGTDDRVQGRKWEVNKRTGETGRKYSLPDNSKWGRVKRRTPA